MQEIGKFDVKISVIPNGLESLVFIGSMQFMNSSLDTLFNNLSDNDYHDCLSREFSVYHENLVVIC